MLKYICIYIYVYIIFYFYIYTFLTENTFSISELRNKNKIIANYCLLNFMIFLFSSYSYLQSFTKNVLKKVKFAFYLYFFKDGFKDQFCQNMNLIFFIVFFLFAFLLCEIKCRRVKLRGPITINHSSRRIRLLSLLFIFSFWKRDSNYYY